MTSTVACDNARFEKFEGLHCSLLRYYGDVERFINQPCQRQSCRQLDPYGVCGDKTHSIQYIDEIRDNTDGFGTGESIRTKLSTCKIREGEWPSKSSKDGESGLLM